MIAMTMQPTMPLKVDMNRLVTQYSTSMLRMAFLYLKDTHLAEDALQDAFIKIFSKYPGFENERVEKAWVMRVLINVCKDMLRKSYRKYEDEAEALETIPVDGGMEQADDTPLVEIMKLPETYKEVILLFYYQDMSIKDIATVLDASQNAVTVRLNRARAMLKNKLEGWYFGDEQ